MILVTGASGLLGASVVLQAVETHRPVTGLCWRHLLQVSGADTYTVDLTNSAETRRVIADLRPSSIIHCAAATGVDWCEDHPDQADQINVCASSLLAELAQEIDAQFLQISTDSVFDGERGNYSEKDPPAPLNVYAKTKLAAELGVLRHHRSPLIARANFYGWNAQEKQSLGEWILGQLRNGNPVPGFTDVYFCPMLVNHLAEMLLTMLDRGISGIYHVVGSERISKYEFARRLAVTFGFEPERVVPILAGEAKLRAARPLDTSMNTEKISNELGQAMPGVEDGLGRFKSLHDQNYVQLLKGYLAGVGK